MSEMVDVGGVRARVTADISNYASAMDQAKAKTQELGEQSKKAAADIEQIGSTGNKIKTLTATLDNINARIELQQRKLAGLKASYDTTFNPERKAKLEEKILATEAALIKLTSKSEETAGKIWELEDSADEACGSIQKLKTALSQAGLSSSGIDEVTRSLRQANPELLRGQIAEVTDEMKKLGATDADIAKVTQQIEKSAQGAKEAEGSLQKLRTALTATGVSSKDIEKVERSLKRANPELLRKQIAEVTDEMRKLGASDKEIEKVTKSLEKGAKGASGFSKELKTLGIAYGALTAAMTAVISKAIETSRTFEQSMANVKAISQATSAEFELLRKQALALGSTTIFTASQAADAQALLAQAGFKTNDILAAMPGMLSLAASGQTDLATTADIAASALNGFQLAAGETGRVVDVLAKSSIDTNADVTDLGMALKYVAPVAASMGVSIEEAVAAIGELSNAGIKGEMAGTQLRAMLLALASPSNEAAGYLQQLGVSIADASGKIRPLGDIIGQLETSFARLTQEQQADAAATIAGREAASGFLTLISQGKSTLDSYTASLQNSGGTAESVANTQMDTLNGAIVAMQSALEGVGITVGDTFAPAIRKVAETITEALVGFNQLNPALQAAIVALPVAAIGVMGLVTAVYALVAAFTALNISFPILGAISLAIGAVVAGVAALVSWSNQAAEAAKKHDEAQKSLNETLNQSPVKRTVAELEDLQQRTEELNEVLRERESLQRRLSEIESLGDQGLGTPEMLAEALEINDELERMDKLLHEMGYDGVEDATEKLGEMKQAAKESTAALFEMRKEEINDLATKKQTVDGVGKLIDKYSELNAKQELDAAQKRELVATVNALKREYPDLNAKMDEEGRIRVENLDVVELQIQKDRQFLEQAVQTQKVYLQNLIATTEQQRKAVEAQISNYQKLLSAMNAVNGAKALSEGKGPVKRDPNAMLKMANPLLGNFVDNYVEDKVSDLYEQQNAFAEQERELKKAMNSLTSGEFASDAISDPIKLGKEKKEKKPKAKKEKKTKSAAELAAEARKKAYDADLATIRFQAEMFDWSTDKQIKAYERLRKTHERHLKDTVDDRRTLDLQVKRLNEDTVKSQFDFSAEWIKQEERRMELSGKSENEIVNMKLKAWTRVRDRYAADSEFYKRADDQVYQARKALMDKTVKLAEDSVKVQKASIESVKKAELDAIKKRKEAALADYDARIKAIDELIAKEAEYNSDADLETALREKQARIDELASAVGPEGIAEREQAIKDRDRMILEHERELRKRELESQKGAIQDEKNARSDAFDAEITETEAQFDKLIDAFSSYSGDIKLIEAVLAEFRVSEAGKANAAILAELDSFVTQYNAKMAQVETLRTADELAEYNANKDAWAAAKARGDTAEMARLNARNQAIRDKYGIDKDTGKLQSFHGGGIVRGARGAETIVLAKAGEMVLTDRQQAVLFEALSGISARPVSQPSGAVTHNTFQIDMGVGEVTLEDSADIQAFYDERARTVERLQTQGVKTR